MYVNTLCAASVTKQAMFVIYMQHHNLRVFLCNENAEYYVNAKRGWIHSLENQDLLAHSLYNVHIILYYYIHLSIYFLHGKE
jgi:hypothetical protein